jgi:SAM-dependent methyltransferase
MSDATSDRIVPRSDRHQLERLNRLWKLTEPLDPGRASWRDRVMRLLSPAYLVFLYKQRQFNAILVDHINRNMEIADETTAWLQRSAVAADALERQREWMLARERRIEAGIGSMTATHDELRSAIGILQQATQSLKREVARLAESPGPQPQRHRGTEDGSPGTSTTAEALDSHQYVGFEDRFRGDQDEIRKRLEEYVPIFAGASDVLDIGCGRGEFLALLRDHRIGARGIDINRAMVDVTRDKRLDATEADALTYLRAQPDGSLGGLFAAQVVEHLEPRYLTQLLDAAFARLRPGSPIVLETINPACWFAFFESYIRDITHVRPLHPDTLKYLLVANGFQRVEIRYRTPYPEADKLQPVPDRPGPDLGDWAATLNENAGKINRLLFTHLDYAAIGRRP